MEEFFSILQSSWTYMTHVPLFWSGLGFTTAIAMFAGAFVYDGDLTETKKGIISVFAYASMMLWMAIIQIVDARFNHPEILTVAIKPTTYIVALNVVVVSVAWILGVYLGSLILHIKQHGKPIRK